MCVPPKNVNWTLLNQVFKLQIGKSSGQGAEEHFDTRWANEDWQPAHQSLGVGVCGCVCTREWHFYKPSDERSAKPVPLPDSYLQLHLAEEPAVCVGVDHLVASPQCLFEAVGPPVT